MTKEIKPKAAKAQLNIRQKLMRIQSELKAPKGQFNKFGNYKYRSAEDILEALKPLLHKYDSALLISDEIELIGDRYYIKSIAKILDCDGTQWLEATGYAREPLDKKGMDLSQLTGSSSSYATKYAMNKLFAIDDNKDADSTNQHGKSKSTAKSLADKPAAPSDDVDDLF